MHLGVACLREGKLIFSWKLSKTSSSSTRHGISWPPHPFHDLVFPKIWSGLALGRSCACFHSESEFIGEFTSHIVSRKLCFLTVAHCLWLLESFGVLFCVDTWALTQGQGGGGLSISFRVEHYIILFSALGSITVLPINCHLLQEASLMWIERCTDLWV